jgi:glucose/arabinose dehydrogenase
MRGTSLPGRGSTYARRLVTLTLMGLLVGVATTACSGDGDEGSPADSPVAERENPSAPRDRVAVAITIADELEVPWGVAFLPDGSALVTERDSRRLLRIGPAATGEDVREEGVAPAGVTEIAVIDQAAPRGEGGLLGVAVSPSFKRDRRVFLYLTTESDNRIVRTTLREDRIGPLTTLVTGIPDAQIHDGGRLAFGPDGYLYASTGDSAMPDLAQDRTSLAGKICGSPRMASQPPATLPATHRFGAGAIATSRASRSTTRASCGHRSSASIPGMSSTASSQGKTMAGRRWKAARAVMDLPTLR